MEKDVAREGTLKLSHETRDFFSASFSVYCTSLDLPVELLTLSTPPAARWKLFNASIH